MSSAAPKDVMKLLSGSVVAKAFGLVSVMIFARLLSKEQMAIFPAYLMLAALPVLFLSFGIYALFVRELPSLVRSDAEKARSLVVTGSALIVAGTIVPCLACWWWSDAVSLFVFKTTTQAWAIRIMIPGFMAFVVSKTADQIMWGRGQFGATSLVQILESVVRPVATVALFFWLGYRGIVVGLVVAQFVMAAIALWRIRDMFLSPLPPLYPLRSLLSQSMPYYIGNYLAYFRGDGDSILVTTFLGPAALAEYYVAKVLYTNMTLIWTAVDRVACERLARWVRAPVFGRKVKELSARIAQTIIPFCLFAIAVAPGALVVLAGARYAAAAGPAVILLVASLVLFIAIPYDRAVYVALPGTVRLKFTAIEAVVVVAAAVALVPLLGLPGVALACVLAPTGVCVFGAYLLRKYLRLILPLKPTLLALGVTVPGAVIALLVTPPAHGAASALSGVAIAATIWTAVSFALGYFFNRPLLDAVIQDLVGCYRLLVSS